MLRRSGARRAGMGRKTSEKIMASVERGHTAVRHASLSFSSPGFPSVFRPRVTPCPHSACQPAGLFTYGVDGSSQVGTRRYAGITLGASRRAAIKRRPPTAPAALTYLFKRSPR